VNHAENGKVAIFGTERSVEDVDVIHEFRSKSPQRAQVSLAVALSGLILLNIIDHDFQPAVDSAMIEIESETANLERLATALVLPGIYPGRQRVKDLVVAGEECSLEAEGPRPIQMHPGAYLRRPDTSQLHSA
jgi:hypothetical protein